MASKKNKWKKKVAIGAGTAIVALGFWASRAFYSVREVVDGDTFVTTENQYIRFGKIDAPELDNCLGNEAKTELEKLVLNKKVFIKINYKEPSRGRLVGSVYTSSGNVEEAMLKKGLAVLRGGLKQASLSKVANEARLKEIGVYSSTCTQKTNPNNTMCNIKANIRQGEKYYRYPGCEQYETTLVQLHLGDKWFCSEKEAVKSGFSKGKDCN